METLEWVERFGGWAVVLAVVRWMMARIDRLIDTFERAIDTFHGFEREERKVHEEILRRLDALRDAG